MKASIGAQYRHLQGLSRGLSVLECRNLASGGKATLKDRILQPRELHRTAVRRLLEPRLAARFVRRSDSGDIYWLDSVVLRLSEESTDDEWSFAFGAPALGDLF